MMDKNYSLVQNLMRVLIELYQIFISPFLGGNCRFTPTCSQYAMEAIELHGAFKGCWLALCRLGRCHPFHPGGYDPVPPTMSD